MRHRVVAFGLEAFLNSGSEWFADEEFWEWSFPLMFPARRFEQAPDEVDQLIALSGQSAGTLLDLACGPGRHSAEFAKRGFDVTGVDRSSFLLDQARSHARASGVDVEWIHEDMRKFDRPGSFDLAISIFTSFGYFQDAADNQAVLENLYSSLAPGGALVMHVLGKEPLARRFLATEWSELDGDAVLVQHRVIEGDWSRLHATWVVIEGDSAKRFSFRVWIYSGSELERMLMDAGFASVALFGSLSGDPYDIDAGRLVAVARRGEG